MYQKIFGKYRQLSRNNKKDIQAHYNVHISVPIIRMIVIDTYLLITNARFPEMAKKRRKKCLAQAAYFLKKLHQNLGKMVIFGQIILSQAEMKVSIKSWNQASNRGTCYLNKESLNYVKLEIYTVNFKYVFRIIAWRTFF